MTDTFIPVGKPAAEIVSKMRKFTVHEGGKGKRVVPDDGLTMRMFRDSAAALDKQWEKSKAIELAQTVILKNLARLAILMNSGEAAYQWLLTEIDNDRRKGA